MIGSAAITRSANTKFQLLPPYIPKNWYTDNGRVLLVGLFRKYSGILISFQIPVNNRIRTVILQDFSSGKIM